MDLTNVVMNELRVIGTMGGPMSEAIRALQCGAVDVVSLMSRRKSLNDGPELLRAAQQPGVMKVIVDI